MNVTLLTDASWCPTTKAGGYGFWCRSERGGVPGEGRLRRLYANPTEAELAAIANSLHVCVRDELIMRGDIILLQTDCQAAIGRVQNWDNHAVGGKRTLTEEELAVAIIEFTVQWGLVLNFRWVKAHTAGLDARSASNNWCDLRAKRQMRALRDDIVAGRHPAAPETLLARTPAPWDDRSSEEVQPVAKTVDKESA